MEDPKPKTIKPGRYQHSKTKKYYEVIGVALHTETQDQLVIYRPLYGSQFQYFVRPYSMFTEEVVFNGVRMPRFECVKE